MNQRLNQTIKSLKEQRRIHSASDFAQIIGIDKSDLSRMVNGKMPISQRIVGLIVAKFPDLNKDWLLNGEGEMLKNTTSIAENHSISIAGEEVKENEINVNTDKTIESLINEMSAQRTLTERALAEIAAQRQLTETALKQNSDLIAILKGHD